MFKKIIYNQKKKKNSDLITKPAKYKDFSPIYRLTSNDKFKM